MPADHGERVSDILAVSREFLSGPRPDREHEFRAVAAPARRTLPATSAPSSLSDGPISANASNASSAFQTWLLASFVTRAVYVGLEAILTRPRPIFLTSPPGRPRMRNSAFVSRLGCSDPTRRPSPARRRGEDPGSGASRSVRARFVCDSSHPRFRRLCHHPYGRTVVSWAVLRPPAPRRIRKRRQCRAPKRSLAPHLAASVTEFENFEADRPEPDRAFRPRAFGAAFSLCAPVWLRGGAAT